MSTHAKGLHERIAKASDFELLEMLRDEPNGWRPEALSLAREELTRRGISSDVEKAMYLEEAEYEAEEEAREVSRLAGFETFRWLLSAAQLLFVLLLLLLIGPGEHPVLFGGLLLIGIPLLILFRPRRSLRNASEASGDPASGEIELP